MKIVLISGKSKVGKTSICKKLCDKYPNKYNFIQSYTDRQKREKNEWGHTFVDPKKMDLLLERSDIVAKTTIEENRYCTLREQFDDNKINLYTVDVYGIDDTISTFSNEYIVKILIRRDKIEGDCVRVNRDVSIPTRNNVDFIIDNNGTIDSSANLLNTFINFDFFHKPHAKKNLYKKLDYINMQYRFLNKIKESFFEQLWYQELIKYRKLCAYVEEKINKDSDFDFKITIAPDTAPEIFDGDLTYNLQAQHDRDNLTWDETNHIIEQLSHYAYEFDTIYGCDDIRYRLIVSECCIDEDNYL